MTRHKHTHSTLIDRVGSEIARGTFGLTPQGLYAWRTRGIPVTKRIAFAKLCASQGVPTPPDFFEDFEIKARSNTPQGEAA